MNLLEIAETVDKLDDLKVLRANTRKDATHSVGPFIRDHYFIMYCVKGSGIIKLMDKTYSVKEGQGVCIPPGIVNYLKGAAEDPWSYFFFTFHGLHANTLCNQINIHDEKPVYSIKDHDNTYNELNILIDSNKLWDLRPIPEHTGLKVLSLLYSYIYNVLEQLGAERNQSTKTFKDVYVKTAIDYIKINYPRRIYVSQIAEAVGLNMSYLGQLFKEQTQLTPQQYLCLYRIEKACEFMRQPSLSISEIARSVGYEDPLLFSRVFKRVKSLSPSQFRLKLYADYE